MKNKSVLKARGFISRRTFINHAATGTAVIALGPVTNLIANDIQQVEPWPADASKFRFHMIGYAHIDIVRATNVFE